MSPPHELQMDEWATLDAGSVPQLAGLWPDSPDVAAAVEALPGHALRISACRSGLRITARQHVGVVRLGPVQVRIRPKLPPGDLWTALAAAMRLPAESHRPPVDDVLDGDFIDALARLLLRESDRLWRLGPHRTYRTHSDWLASPRGRPELAELARHQPLLRAALPCRFHDRTTDNPTNAVVAGALKLASRWVRSTRLRGALHRAARQWSDLCAHTTLDADLLQSARRTRSRLNARYDAAHAISALLLAGLGRGEGEGEGPNARLPGFLVDMAGLWEDFLEVFLREHLPPGWTVTAQHTIRHLYAVDRAPAGWRAPRPRPDLVISENGRTHAVIDAKYRDIIARGLPRDILYQLSVYALAWSTEARGGPVPAVALCPSLEEPAEAWLTVRPPAGQVHRVGVRTVDWSAALALLRRGDRTAARQLALQWVGADVPRRPGRA